MLIEYTSIEGGQKKPWRHGASETVLLNKFFHKRSSLKALTGYPVRSIVLCGRRVHSLHFSHLEVDVVNGVRRKVEADDCA